jgi:putative methylase
VTSRVITIRRHELAIKLQSVEPHPYPNVALEQYEIPADFAAEILFRACYEFGDIEGKSILDLGTGVGRLALGASLLGAEYVVGVDLDLLALELAAGNCKRMRLEADWVLSNLDALRGPVDTVVMNPPFGTKRPHADTQFLRTAITIGKVVYSIHKAATRLHLSRWFSEHGCLAAVIMSAEMEIPHQFSFHSKEKHYVDVDVFRIVRD